MQQIINKDRYSLLYSLIISFLIINFITRVVLIFMDIGEVDLGIITLLKMFIVGFIMILLQFFTILFH